MFQNVARGEHGIRSIATLLHETAEPIDDIETASVDALLEADRRRVAAASDWGEPMEHMRVRRSHADSYERLFHEAGVPALMLHLREPARRDVRDELLTQRLERAIGVVYRPDTELQSRYFYASLPRQFDEYVWFDETHAVHTLRTVLPSSARLPETYPFGT